MIIQIILKVDRIVVTIAPLPLELLDMEVAEAEEDMVEAEVLVAMDEVEEMEVEAEAVVSQAKDQDPMIHVPCMEAATLRVNVLTTSGVLSSDQLAPRAAIDSIKMIEAVLLLSLIMLEGSVFHNQDWTPTNASQASPRSQGWGTNNRNNAQGWGASASHRGYSWFVQ